MRLRKGPALALKLCDWSALILAKALLAALPVTFLTSLTGMLTHRMAKERVLEGTGRALSS